MKGAVIGLLVGIALTSLGFFYFASHRDDVLSARALDNNGANATAADDAEGSQVGEGGPDAIGGLENEPSEARASAPAARDQPQRAANAGAWANAPPPALPIILPPEFAYLTDEPLDLHERLQREPIDPRWSVATQTQIDTYFAVHPEISGKYSFPTVNCRTSACEVAFVARGLEQTTPIYAASMFIRENSAFFDQPWVPESLSSVPILPHLRVGESATTIIWYLPRRQE